MSFSSDTKNELCKVECQKCCAVAQCYGIVLYCNTFSNSEVKIVTENQAFAKILPRLFKRAFGFSFDSTAKSKSGKESFIIKSPEKIGKIFSVYGYEKEDVLAHHINYGVIEEECCRQSFIRGAFLAGGSVTDPEKQYHLELVTAHYNVSRETYSLLLDMGFSPKSASRSGNHIIYFKSSAAIEDFLTTIGAPVSAMDIMSAKIEKGMTNSVNRLVNCDTANVAKTVDAAQSQIEAINILKQTGKFKSLPEKLKYTAEMRLKNPELSLSELAEVFDPPVTKSGLNHRFRKIMELAGK